MYPDGVIAVDISQQTKVKWLTKIRLQSEAFNNRTVLQSPHSLLTRSTDSVCEREVEHAALLNVLMVFNRVIRFSYGNNH